MDYVLTEHAFFNVKGNDIREMDILQRLFGKSQQSHGPVGAAAGDVLHMDTVKCRRQVRDGMGRRCGVHQAGCDGVTPDPGHLDVLKVQVFGCRLASTSHGLESNPVVRAVKRTVVSMNVAHAS